jgi:hypothetical protein
LFAIPLDVVIVSRRRHGLVGWKWDKILEWTFWRYRAVLIFFAWSRHSSSPVWRYTSPGVVLSSNTERLKTKKKQRSGKASRVVSMNILSPEFMQILSPESDTKSFWRECRYAHGWAGDNASPKYLGVIT